MDKSIGLDINTFGRAMQATSPYVNTWAYRADWLVEPMQGNARENSSFLPKSTHKPEQPIHRFTQTCFSQTSCSRVSSHFGVDKYKTEVLLSWSLAGLLILIEAHIQPRVSDTSTEVQK